MTTKHIGPSRGVVMSVQNYTVWWGEQLVYTQLICSHVVAAHESSTFLSQVRKPCILWCYTTISNATRQRRSTASRLYLMVGFKRPRLVSWLVVGWDLTALSTISQHMPLKL